MRGRQSRRRCTIQESIEVPLQFNERKLESFSERRLEKLLEEKRIKLLAMMEAGTLDFPEDDVPNPVVAEKLFKGMGQRQPAIIARFSGVNFFDSLAAAREKRQDATRQKVGGIRGAAFRIQLRECGARIPVKRDLSVNAVRPGEAANHFDGAEEKRALEQRMPGLDWPRWLYGLQASVSNSFIG